MNAAEWIETIKNTHHAYLRKELPGIAKAVNTQLEQSGGDPEWQKLAKAFFDLKHELETHILKEEVMLFVSILHIEASVASHTKPDLKHHDIRESLEQAEYEHDATRQFLETIDSAISKIKKNSDNQILFDQLEHLKKDLEEHIHKEEQGLFPEAKFLYAKATEGMLREE